ncbi:MAG: prepilin-type N-terminal cleavage/methylation domain-containing protein [Rickettsiales bacterium]|nr:prepilin-type N-terminal cleavage/methylation domain-containing protein [Rickettsiales bacterium]
MKKAFSLTEIAIAITIIGLLTAGVTGGQSLLKQAKIINQVDQFLEFKRAIGLFDLTYNAIPGDFNQATSYFTGSNIVNGNQNGYINGTDGARRYEDRAVNGEKIHFFRHLSLAGFITKDYDATTLNKGTGIPATILNKNAGIIAASYLRPSPFGGDDYSGTYTTEEIGGLHIYLVMAYDIDASIPVSVGTKSNNLWARTDKRIFNGKDLYAIDKKIDNGLPYNGDLMGFRTGCTDSAYTAYDLSNDVDQCYAMYKLKEK